MTKQIRITLENGRRIYGNITEKDYKEATKGLIKLTSLKEETYYINPDNICTLTEL